MAMRPAPRALLRTIVLVTDDPLFPPVLAHTLDGAYQIHTAPDTPAARSLLVEHPPHLLILSMEPDEPASFALLAEFRQRSIAPVLLLARHVSETAAIQALALRASAYLKTPCAITTISAQVRKLLADGPPPELLAEQARQLIDGNGNLGLSGAEVAARLGVSEKQLRGVFRRRFGRTPAQYLRAARIRRAQHLLTTTMLPVAAIAAQAGFRDATYLAAVFQREVGLTPLAFRQTHWNPDAPHD